MLAFDLSSQGVIVIPTALLKPIYKNVLRYLGDQGVPQDMLRRRRLSLETMRRFGTPVLIKHMYTIEDVEKEIAEPSVGLDTVYQQPIHDDQLSYGIGYVSVEKSPRGEWIKPATETVACYRNGTSGTHHPRRTRTRMGSGSAIPRIRSWLLDLRHSSRRTGRRV